MQIPRLLMVGSVGLLLAALGCDSSSDSNGSSTPTLNTGLESKTLSSLNQSEIDQLNKAVADYMASLISKADACKMAGFVGAGMAAMASGQAMTDATLQKACSDMASTCNNSPSPPESTSSGEATSASLANCEATVAEFETCMKDTGAATKETMKSIPECSAITVSSMDSSDSGMTTSEQPASCKSLQTKCPNLDTSGSSDTTE